MSDDVRQQINEQASAVEKQVVDWRHQVHQNPELSNRESATAKLVADRLKSLDFDDVKTGVAHHGVVGVLKGGMPGDKRAWPEAGAVTLEARTHSTFRQSQFRVDGGCECRDHVEEGISQLTLIHPT